MTLRQIYYGWARRQRASFKEHDGRAKCAECSIWHHYFDLFRCLYCGVWYCKTCAEVHFGTTIEDYEAARPEPNTTT